MVFGDKEFAFAGQRFAHDINIGYSLAFILVVLMLNAVAVGERRPGFADQLLGRFVETDDRKSGVIRLFVFGQYLFHCRHIAGIRLRNHPTFDLPGLDFVFFSSRPTVVWLMASTCESATI